MSASSISAVIPAFNAEHSIAAAVRSVHEQTVPVNEIIVIDDGSTDQTLQVLQRLSSEIPALRVLSQANAGPAAARNLGIREAKSKWIAFLDADDLWLPKKVELQMQLVSEYPALNWVAGAYRREKHSNGKYLPAGAGPVARRVRDRSGVYNALEVLASGTTIWTGTVVVRSCCLKDQSGFAEDLRGCEDYYLWTRLAIAYTSLGFIISPIAKYSVANSNSVTGTSRSQIEPSQFTHYERLRSLANNAADAHQGRLLNRILKRKVNTYAMAFLRAGNPDEALRLTRLLRARELPVPSFLTRLCSRIPPTILSRLRNAWLRCKQ